MHNSKDNRGRTQSIALGFLAGYVDTLGFLALFGLFTAHVTGNFILIGAGLANPGTSQNHLSILLKLLALPAFIAGVGVVPLLVAWTRARNVRALPLAFGLQLLLLAAFMLCGMAALPLGAAPGDLAMAAGLFGAAAMGVHSAIGRLLLGQLAPTSMMTGNVTQVVIDTVDYLRGARDVGLGQRCAKFVWPVLAFGLGAIVSAFAWYAAGFVALALTLAILAFLIRMGWSRRRSRRPHDGSPGVPHLHKDTGAVTGPLLRWNLAAPPPALVIGAIMAKPPPGAR